MNERILAIDAGNTRVKWGLNLDYTWLHRGAATTAEFVRQPQLLDLLAMHHVDHVVVSNVAGTAVAQAIAELLQPLGKTANFVVARARQCGVMNGYDEPSRLGSDRWAALIATHVAATSKPRPHLVVMAGTAVTIDALTADGYFLGGVIMPGTRLMRSVLNSATAQLPLSDGIYQAFPTNTDNAITSGTIEACAGAIARQYTQLTNKLGSSPQCVASGGGMQELVVYLPFPVSINDNLVLDGLLAIARSRNPAHQDF
ncbi:MAG: type III pantothenate kinase [Betaproteobacteria bacterium]